MFKLQLGNNATHHEAIWCEVVSSNSAVTVAYVVSYVLPKKKIENAIKAVGKIYGPLTNGDHRVMD